MKTLFEGYLQWQASRGCLSQCGWQYPEKCIFLAPPPLPRLCTWQTAQCADRHANQQEPGQKNKIGKRGKYPLGGIWRRSRKTYSSMVVQDTKTCSRTRLFHLESGKEEETNNKLQLMQLPDPCEQYCRWIIIHTCRCQHRRSLIARWRWRRCPLSLYQSQHWLEGVEILLLPHLGQTEKSLDTFSSLALPPRGTANKQGGIEHTSERCEIGCIKRFEITKNIQNCQLDWLGFLKIFHLLFKRLLQF